MSKRILAPALGGLSLAAAVAGFAETAATARRTLVLENSSARLVVDAAGGSIAAFQFRDMPLNPLDWGTPAAGNTAPQALGHFLCLDRWGPPSDAEKENGMPYHGEASHVVWKAPSTPRNVKGASAAVMTARLPLAGLSVKRTLRLARGAALFVVTEEIRNRNKLGRIYNAVQHPTIAPPFLDETTVVDCNGTKGFAQGGVLPNPEEPAFHWPQAVDRDGRIVNLRQLAADPNPNVVSYAIEENFGWVTAATPGKGLLIGYIWKTSDYPWVSLWRDVQNGKPSARGLEFGTTGLHQPYPILVRKGRIFDRPLFEHLDADETAVKSYAGFLFKIPADFAGVASIRIEEGSLILRERREAGARELSLSAEGLLPLK